MGIRWCCSVILKNVVYVLKHFVSVQGVVPKKKERGATVIIRIKNLLINSHRGWRYQWCCCCVQGVCCSQWYNLFIPLNLISLTRSCARSLAVTQSPDYRTLSLSHPFHPTLPVNERGKAGLSRLRSALPRRGSSANVAAHSHKRVQTRTFGSSLRNTEPAQAWHKMWIISRPTGCVRQTKRGLRACTHAYARIHTRSGVC